MTEKTPAELREQRARLIASTGLTETVLRERAEAFQLYPEHHDIWATVEGIDYLLSGTRSDVGTEFVQQADHPDEAALAAFEADLDSSTAPKDDSKDAALREWLPVLRRAVESLPAKCPYHDDTTPHGVWREACCDTGIPARRRELAEKALAALSETKEQI
ncbi:hypothetical protein ACFUJX_19780 [Streptomyces rubiginosohelvolus]|uniref:hypothetical protein n=1 Tax=Streptomyces rubiginosohelvolus TaxID=67362 RepID=UPI00363AC65C